ncbi:MAG: hypothetical protein RI935_254 [Candidatus Parcubacteria bacterium]|jgi:hypothetical protein
MKQSRVTKPVKKVIRTRTKKTLASSLSRHAKILCRSLLLSGLFQKSVKTITLIMCVSVVGYSSYQFISKSFASDVVVSKSEIINRVSKLVEVPDTKPYSIVRVEDADLLKTQNDFYKEVQEGDYIIMYKNVAIIYNLRTNMIVSMRKIGE